MEFSYFNLYGEHSYNTPGPLIAKSSLYVCDEDTPPKYREDSTGKICRDDWS